MSLSKSKCLHSNICLCFLKRAVPLGWVGLGLLFSPLLFEGFFTFGILTCTLGDKLFLLSVFNVRVSSFIQVCFGFQIKGQTFVYHQINSLSQQFQMFATTTFRLDTLKFFFTFFILSKNVVQSFLIS
jgi:hypothetical protein